MMGMASYSGFSGERVARSIARVPLIERMQKWTWVLISSLYVFVERNANKYRINININSNKNHLKCFTIYILQTTISCNFAKIDFLLAKLALKYPLSDTKILWTQLLQNRWTDWAELLYPLCLVIVELLLNSWADWTQICHSHYSSTVQYQLVDTIVNCWICHRW